MIALCDPSDGYSLQPTTSYYVWYGMVRYAFCETRHAGRKIQKLLHSAGIHRTQLERFQNATLPSGTIGVAKLLSMIIIITKTLDSHYFYDALYRAVYVEVLFS